MSKITANRSPKHLIDEKGKSLYWVVFTEKQDISKDGAQFNMVEHAPQTFSVNDWKDFLRRKMQNGFAKTTIIHDPTLPDDIELEEEPEDDDNQTSEPQPKPSPQRSQKSRRGK